MIKFREAVREDDGSGVLIPVTVRREYCGGTTVSAYKELLDALKTVVAEDDFSEECFRAIESICENAGYVIERDIENSHSYVYERSGGGAVCGAAVPLGEDASELENLLDGWDLRETLELNDSAYIRIVDRKIVSIAVGNLIREFGDAEIAVETAEEYRGNGYACECINAVCGELDGRICYVCDTENIPSQRTAEKCGFTRSGEVKYFISFEDE